MMTPKEMAQAYAETIYGPANAWGEHVHPIQGRSDLIMLRLRHMVGEVESERLLNEAMSEHANKIREAKSCA